MRTPACWGPSFWLYFHAWARRYPTFPSDSDRVHAIQLWDVTASNLPCETCVEHFRKLVHDTDPKTGQRSLAYAATSRGLMERWLIAAHNEVNQRLGKPLQTEEGALHAISAISDTEFGQLSWFYILESALDDRPASELARLIRLHALRNPFASTFELLAKTLEDTTTTGSLFALVVQACASAMGQTPAMVERWFRAQCPAPPVLGEPAPPAPPALAPTPHPAPKPGRSSWIVPVSILIGVLVFAVLLTIVWFASSKGTPQ